MGHLEHSTHLPLLQPLGQISEPFCGPAVKRFAHRCTRRQTPALSSVFPLEESSGVSVWRVTLAASRKYLWLPGFKTVVRTCRWLSVWSAGGGCSGPAPAWCRRAVFIGCGCFSVTHTAHTRSSKTNKTMGQCGSVCRENTALFLDVPARLLIPQNGYS